MVGSSFCSAINCHNSKKKNKDKSYFSFPLNSDLSKRWVINTRREDLLYRNSQYLRSNCCLCSDHFEPQCFLNFLKNRLKPDAVPTLFDVPNPPKELAPKRRKLTRTDNIFKGKTELSDQGNKAESSTIYMQPVEETFEKEDDLSCQQFSNYREVATQVESVITVDQNTQTDAILTSHSPRKKQLRAKVKCLNVSMQQLKRKTEICEAQRKAHQNPKSIESIIEAAKKYLPQKVLSFFSCQLKLHQKKPKGRRYSNDSKLLFLSIYYYSPQCYRFLSKFFAFPHKSTLLRWLKLYINSGPDLNNQILETMKLKVENMHEKDRLCMICFDELSLKPSLAYDRKSDCVVGFEDFSGNLRTPKISNSALVFMVRGIIGKWKQSIGFALTSGPCKSNRVQTLLFQLLEKLNSIGLLVKAVVSDQGCNFMQMFKKLGVSENRPYFEHDGHSYFVIFDAPHLLKSIRNNFFKYDVIFDSKIASWQDIIQTFQIDSKHMFRCVRKLTEKHISLPLFSKMKVSLAAQVLSFTMAAAIETFVSLGVLPIKAIGTAEFCHNFDDIFDCTNSSSSRSLKALRKPWSATSCHKDIIHNFLEWLGTCHFIDKTGNDVTKRIKCIRGWKISLQSLLLIWDNLSIEHGVQYLSTRRINQDCIENFFGSVRLRNGYNVKPTPLQFCRAFRQMSLHCLLTSLSSGANCLADNDEFLLSKLSDICDSISTECSSAVVFTDSSQPIFSNSIIIRDFQLPEKNALQYVAGFLVLKSLQQHPECSSCRCLTRSVSLDASENYYLYFKEYDDDHLVAPSNDFVNTIVELEKIFIDTFQKKAHNRGIGYYLINDMNKLEISLPKCFPLKFLIEYYVRLRIYYTLRFFNKSVNVKEMKSQKFFQLPHLKP